MAAAAAAETATMQNNILEWVKRDNRRLLHVVYRVADLEKTIKYACSQHVLGVF
jgi:lactoylglutathione lyase